MKTLFAVLACLAFCITGTPAKEPASRKVFDTAMLGSGYRYYTCQEGEQLHYVVFGYWASPKPNLLPPGGPEVKVANASSRNPKAVLKGGGTPERDLLKTPDTQIYQIEKDGTVRTFAERVTAQQLTEFLRSKPDVISAEGLLAHAKAPR